MYLDQTCSNSTVTKYDTDFTEKTPDWRISALKEHLEKKKENHSEPKNYLESEIQKLEAKSLTS